VLQDQILAGPRHLHQDPFASTKSRHRRQATSADTASNRFPVVKIARKNRAVTRVALVRAAIHVRTGKIDEVG
jgi:hypothetical protein